MQGNIERHLRSGKGVTRAAAALLATALLAFSSAVSADHQGDVVRERLQASADQARIVLSEPGDGHNRLRRIEIERGKSVVLETPFTVKRVSVGDPEIADVVVLNPREIHLVAKKIGDTNVVVWNTRNNLQTAIDLHVGAPHSQLEAELGRVLSNDSIRVDSAGESVVLKGTVASPAEMERALRVADAFFPTEKGRNEREHVINLLEVGGNQQVMLEVVIAEMSRTVRRNLGTNFAGVSKGGTDVSIFSFLNNLSSLNDAGLVELSSRVNLAATIVNGSDQLDIFIEAIQEAGLAKILAEPTLVARSGEPAHFLAGGEVPIPVPQSGALGVITIEFKEFGVGVTFTPTVMGPERIHLDVATEVSELDFGLGTAIQGTRVPGFITRRAATGVELGDGQSFAIAGLLRDDVNELTHEFPFLGDLPVLGALFRSTNFEKKESELVMIVTPRLVKPLPAGSHSLPTDNFVEPTATEFFLLGSMEGGVMSHVFGLGEQDPDVAAGPSNPSLGDGIAGDSGHRVDISQAEEGW